MRCKQCGRPGDRLARSWANARQENLDASKAQIRHHSGVGLTECSNGLGIGSPAGREPCSSHDVNGVADSSTLSVGMIVDALSSSHSIDEKKTTKLITSRESTKPLWALGRRVVAAPLAPADPSICRPFMFLSQFPGKWLVILQESVLESEISNVSTPNSEGECLTMKLDGSSQRAMRAGKAAPPSQTFPVAPCSTFCSSWAANTSGARP